MATVPPPRPGVGVVAFVTGDTLTDPENLARPERFELPTPRFVV